MKVEKGVQWDTTNPEFDNELRCYLMELTLPSLKNYCKEFHLRGFSSLNKTKIIQLLIDGAPPDKKKELLGHLQLETAEEEYRLIGWLFHYDFKFPIKQIEIIEQNKDVKIKAQFGKPLYMYKNIPQIYSTVIFINLNDPTSIIGAKGKCTCDFAKKGLMCRHQWVCIALAFQRNQLEMKRWIAPPLPQKLKQAISAHPFDQLFTSLEDNIKRLEAELEPLESRAQSGLRTVQSNKDYIYQVVSYSPDYARDLWGENQLEERELTALWNQMNKIRNQIRTARDILALRQVGASQVTKPCDSTPTDKKD